MKTYKHIPHPIFSHFFLPFLCIQILFSTFLFPTFIAHLCTRHCIVFLQMQIMSLSCSDFFNGSITYRNNFLIFWFIIMGAGELIKMKISPRGPDCLSMVNSWKVHCKKYCPFPNNSCSWSIYHTLEKHGL